MKHLAAILLLTASLAYSQTTVIGGAGGGASAFNDLTDVTITSAADGDGLYNNGTAFVNTALFTPGSTNILAARMATNWGTAGTSACATSGGVMYDNATTVGCASTFRFTGNNLVVPSGVSGGLAFDTTLYIKGNVSSYAIYQAGSGQLGHKFNVDGNVLLELGGSQTALIQDQTATTGDTLFIVKDGAAAAANNLQEWQDKDGNVNAAITAAGAFDATSYNVSGSPLNYSDLAGTVPPQDLKAVIQIQVFAPTTNTATGDGKYYYVVPADLDTFLLTAVSASVVTAGTTGNLDVQLARCDAVTSGSQCSGTVQDMLSTKLRVDTGESNSSDSTQTAVIDLTYDDVNTGEIIRVDVDSVQTTPAQGLIITLEFEPAA